MIDIEFSTIAFTIINLIVLFLLLKKFLIGPLNDVIKKREDMIAGTKSYAKKKKTKEKEKVKKTKKIHTRKGSVFILNLILVLTNLKMYREKPYESFWPSYTELV